MQQQYLEVKVLRNHIPSGKLTWQWNITIFNRTYIFIPGPFSIAMLVCQSLRRPLHDFLVTWEHPKPSQTIREKYHQPMYTQPKQTAAFLETGGFPPPSLASYDWNPGFWSIPKSHLSNGPWNKNLNFIFPTKYGIPKSSKGWPLAE